MWFRAALLIASAFASHDESKFSALHKLVEDQGTEAGAHASPIHEHSSESAVEGGQADRGATITLHGLPWASADKTDKRRIRVKFPAKTDANCMRWATEQKAALAGLSSAEFCKKIKPLKLGPESFARKSVADLLQGIVKKVPLDPNRDAGLQLPDKRVLDPSEKLDDMFPGKKVLLVLDFVELDKAREPEPSKAVDAQPPAASKVVGEQPSETSTVDDAQPSGAAMVVGAQPSEASTVVDAHPSEASTVVGAQPSEASKVVDAQPPKALRAVGGKHGLVWLVVGTGSVLLLTGLLFCWFRSSGGTEHEAMAGTGAGSSTEGHDNAAPNRGLGYPAGGPAGDFGLGGATSASSGATGDFGLSAPTC